MGSLSRVCIYGLCVCVSVWLITESTWKQFGSQHQHEICLPSLTHGRVSVTTNPPANRRSATLRQISLVYRSRKQTPVLSPRPPPQSHSHPPVLELQPACVPAPPRWIVVVLSRQRAVLSLLTTCVRCQRLVCRHRRWGHRLVMPTATVQKKKKVCLLCVSESCFSCACNKTRNQQKKLVTPLPDAGLSGNSCPVRRRPEPWEPAKRPKCLVILLHAALHLWAVDTKVALHSPCFSLPSCREEKNALKTRSVSGFLFSIDLFLKSSQWKGWIGSSGSRSAAAQAARGRCRLRQGD